MKGTWFKRIVFSAARASPAPAAEISKRPEMTRDFISSAHGNNDQNYDGDGHDDNQQVAVAKRPRREILLSLSRASRQLRQIFVIQLAYVVFHFLVINVRRFHRQLSF